MYRILFSSWRYFSAVHYVDLSTIETTPSECHWIVPGTLDPDE